MSIIINKDTRVIVQGITGKESLYWTKYMSECGTQIVAGVTPNKEGEEVYGIPVFDTVQRALAQHPADAAVVFVPPAFTKNAAIEALYAGLKLVVLLADGLPVQDAMEIIAFAKEHGARVIGPNSPGICTLGEAMLGFVPYWLHGVYQPGRVGLAARSGSLTNEIASHIVKAGYGVSTFIGCGGDPVPGTRFVDVIRLFEKDAETDMVVLVGEVGGTMEEEVAEAIAMGTVKKPVIVYIAGRTAPPDKKMGHAGAIVTMGKGTVAGKEAALIKAGAFVAQTPAEVGKKISELRSS